MTTELKLVRTCERSVTTIRKSGAPSAFGPVNPASTTWLAQERHREYQEARLLESLNSLESNLQTLQSKYLEAYDTFLSVMEGAFALLSAIQTAEIGTDPEV